MSDEVTRIGDRLPMTSRRVVSYGSKPATFNTPLARIEGLADGVVLLRHFATKLHLEFTPAQARQAAAALSTAAYAVEQWQKQASGFNTIRVFRSPTGDVTVEYRGRTRPMRLSKLRARTYRDGSMQFVRSCRHCRKSPPTLYVAADDVREHGSRVHHVQICPDCVDKLAVATRTAVAALVRR